MQQEAGQMEAETFLISRAGVIAPVVQRHNRPDMGDDLREPHRSYKVIDSRLECGRVAE